MGAIHDWSHDPAEAIAYFEAHDNLTAWDKLLQSVPEGSDEVHRRMMRFAALILFTAQGVPFMQSGQEMCRTKQGHHNSYNQPDDINQIDWARKKAYADVVEYHQGMIALRKAHPAFRLRTRPEVEGRVTFTTPPDHRCIEYHIDAANLEGETAERFIILLNGATEPVTFALPEGEWHVMADAYRAGAEPLATVSGPAMLPPHSGMVLMR